MTRIARSRLDKLGVKPESRILVLDIADPGFADELAGRCADVRTSRRTRDADHVLYGSADAAAPGGIAALKRCIKSNGAVWVIYPKGQAHITQTMVRTAGLAAGLVDIKIMSFSETHTGLKFVIPVAAR